MTEKQSKKGRNIIDDREEIPTCSYVKLVQIKDK
jgi:hypothetical protein